MTPSVSGSPLPIHTLWIGENLGPVERMCLASWVRCGHDVTLHAYRDFDVPTGVRIVDATRVIPSDRIFRARRNGSYAVFADLFRVTLMQRFDALWLDTDIFLLRPMSFSERNVLARETDQGRHTVNNAVMRLEPEHPIVRRILEIHRHPWKGIPRESFGKAWQTIIRAARDLKFGPEHLPWGALGYRPINRYLDRERFDGLILGSETAVTAHRVSLFEPVHAPDLFLEAPAIYVHLHKSGVGWNLNAPVPGSIYHLLSAGSFEISRPA